MIMIDKRRCRKSIKLDSGDVSLEQIYCLIITVSKVDDENNEKKNTSLRIEKE